MPAAFDTIAALHRLEDAGLSREAAEAITAANLEAVEVACDASLADRGTLATKADVSELGARTDAGLSELRAHTDAGLSELKAHTDAGLSELKADVSALRAHTDAGLSALRAHTDAGMSALRAEFTERIQATERRTYAAVFAAAGLLFAALKLVP